MTYQLMEMPDSISIIIETAPEQFTSFPADIENPVYLAWLETDDGKAFAKANPTLTPTKK